MRVVSDVLDEAVASTTKGDRLVAHAWRGGQVVAQDLPVTSFSFSWSAAQQMQGQVSVTIADPTGELAPYSPDDALGWGGSRLQLLYVWGDSRIPSVPLGMWRIRRPRPQEVWRSYRPGGSRPRWGFGEGPFGVGPFGDAGGPQAETIDGVPQGALLVHSGGSISINADEETASIMLARLDSEPVVEPSCLAELERLLRPVCAVTISGSVDDRDVPEGLVYEESRMDAAADHIKRVNAAYRMAGDASLEVVPVAGVGPVWDIAGGDMGTLVNVDRDGSDDGFFNQVISRGETEEGVQLRGFAELTDTHPLSPKGPMGPVPRFHRSPAKTASGVQADAETLLATRQDSGEVPVKVACLLHPGLQLHDLVTLQMPTLVGVQPVTGRVTDIDWGSASDGVPSKSMQLGLAVSSEALEAVAWRVRHGA